MAERDHQPLAPSGRRSSFPLEPAGTAGRRGCRVGAAALGDGVERDHLDALARPERVIGRVVLGGAALGSRRRGRNRCEPADLLLVLLRSRGCGGRDPAGPSWPAGEQLPSRYFVAGRSSRENRASSRPARNAAGSITGVGNTFRQPVAIARMMSLLAGALPCTSPSWLPRAMYHGTFTPSAWNRFCARSSKPGVARERGVRTASGRRLRLGPSRRRSGRPARTAIVVVVGEAGVQTTRHRRRSRPSTSSAWSAPPHALVARIGLPENGSIVPPSSTPLEPARLVEAAGCRPGPRS